MTYIGLGQVNLINPQWHSIYSHYILTAQHLTQKPMQVIVISYRGQLLSSALVTKAGCVCS